MIQLDKVWYIKADSNCFTLCNIKQQKNKEGELVDVPANSTFYSNIENALKAYIDTKIREKVSTYELQTFQELRNYIITLKKNMMKVLD